MSTETLTREPLHPNLAVGMPAARALASIAVRGTVDGDLTALRELRNLRDLAYSQLTSVARNLNRDHGHSWADIGAELGITRQAAFQAFAERKPTVDEPERFEGLF